MAAAPKKYRAKKLSDDIDPFENFEKTFGDAERVEICVPRKWREEVPESAGKTFAFVTYCEKYLYFGFEIDKGTLKKNANLKSKSIPDSTMPDWMPTLLQDDRCEVFLWFRRHDEDEHYYAFEVTRSGRAIVSSTKFYRKFDFGVHIQPVFPKSGPFSSGTASDKMVFAIAFEDIIHDAKDLKNLLNGDAELRMGLYRGTRIDERDGEFSWASWVDPDDAKIDFHRQETFGQLTFV